MYQINNKQILSDINFFIYVRSGSGVHISKESNNDEMK